MSWLDNGGRADDMITAYWQGRRELLARGVSYGPEAWEELSRLEVLMEGYEPHDRLEYEIDESTLKTGLIAVIDELRRKDLID